MIERLRRLAAAGWPFFFLFFVFFWPLLILRSSFIGADYRSQHLPWALETFKAVQNGSLPFWTEGMTGGFPLFAEGQCASLYLLNWLGYRLLPFMAAYTWSIPLHFLIGGAGMFLYIRRLGLSRQSAMLGATVFCFASSYAGCFYNTGSLRTLCWLPVVLWLLERARAGEQRAFSFAALCAIVSQQWLAGFPQMAVYAFGYAALHELLAFAEAPSRGRAKEMAVGLFAPLALGTLLAWPQIASTLELVGHSIRQGESASFALWGSVPPVAPVALVFPQWGNTLRFCFYAGILPLLLVAAFFCAPKTGAGRRHAWLLLIFFLLALGKFNPLYRWTVETLSLTSMRNPAKFLFFCVMSLSVLAAHGFDVLPRLVDEGKARLRFGRVLAAFAALAVLLPLGAQAFLGLIAGKQGAISQWYVSRLIAEKGSAAKDASVYFEKMRQFFESLAPLFSYRNPLNIESMLLAAASCLALGLFLRRSLSREKFHFLAGVLLVWDLLVFGFTQGTGFIGNAEAIQTLSPTPAMQRVLARTDKEPGIFAELVADPANELFPPDSNMFYGIQHAGGYSPLLLKGHYEMVKHLGIVDGSLGRAKMSEEVWKADRELIDLLGVRYVHSDRPLAWEGLSALETGEGSYLYENTNALPEAFSIHPGTEGWPLVDTQGIDEAGPNRPDRKRFRVRMAMDGVLTLRTPAYPGWKLYVDGQETGWKIVDGLYMGVPLAKGVYEIDLTFRPAGWFWNWMVTLFALMATVAGAILIQFSTVRSYNRRS